PTRGTARRSRLNSRRIGGGAETALPLRQYFEPIRPEAILAGSPVVMVMAIDASKPDRPHAAGPGWRQAQSGEQSPDADLLAAVPDADAVRALYERHVDAVFHFAVRRCRNPEDVADLG